MQTKTALITGASRGIGKSIALGLAEKKFNVVINYQSDKNAALEVAEMCRQKGAEADICAGDVSLAADCQKLVDFTKERFGSIDVLVNNAGITRDNLAIRMSEKDFDDVIATNLKGPFLCMQAAAKYMIRQRYGRIINISSVTGLRGNPGQINYAAAKAGLIGMTKTLAKELAGRNVNVNAIAPGFITTDMTKDLDDKVKSGMLEKIPLGRFGQAEQVADLVVFLAEETGDYITGQVLSIDGGMNI